MVIRNPEDHEVLKLAHGNQRKTKPLALVEQFAALRIRHGGAGKLVEELTHQRAEHALDQPLPGWLSRHVFDQFEAEFLGSTHDLVPAQE
jgi:hypothetical protein